MNVETIELKALRVYLAVAESLSFTRAADELAMPKSQVSKIVAQLEERLQVVLLERTSRVVRLTEPGRILAARASTLLVEASLMVDDVRAVQQRVGGELKLAAPPALGRFIARELIPEFMHRWPEIRVSLKLSYDYEDLFKEGLDLAFRMGVNRDDSLIEKPLGFASRVVVAAPGYLSQHPPIKTPEDLRQHRCLQVLAGDAPAWFLRSGQQTHTLAMNSAFQCSDMQALLAVLRAGVGVAQLPWLVVREELANNQLVQLLPGWLSEGLTISAVYRHGLNKPAKLAEFLTLIDENKQIFDLSP